MTLRARWNQLPPALSRIRPAALGRALLEQAPAESVRSALAQRLGAEQVTLHASGREALREALACAARVTGRREVLVPAYTCFSVAAACVAAGLKLRLLDLDERGGVDPAQVAERDGRSAAAYLIDNLFGLPSPSAAPAAHARAHGSWLVDDAAQALGASSGEGPVGARGDVGVLSFGRGKPLSGLGGGALAWMREAIARPRAEAPRARVRAALRWLGYSLACRQPLFGCLAAIPALRIGETLYDPGFRRGDIDGAALVLLAAALSDLDAEAARRRERAHELARCLAAAGSDFTPLLEPPGQTGVFPRLALLAPDPPRRDAALAELRVVGASAMYPTPLGAVAALAPHRVGDSRCPGAARFCARLLTVPTHARLGEAGTEKLIRVLGARG